MRTAIFLLAAITISFAYVSKTAEAQFFAFDITYEVQVEYWFFDTDYSYWNTIFETDDYGDAELLFELLEAARDDNRLNRVVPNSYGRYIAVDVRLVTIVTYRQPPSIAPRLEIPFLFAR